MKSVDSCAILKFHNPERRRTAFRHENRPDFADRGSIWKNLTLFAIPILLGQIFQQLYNTADAWIVGHYCNDAQYAAVTSTGSLVFLLVGFFSGIAVGAGVVIARYYGARDEKTSTPPSTPPSPSACSPACC